MKDRETERAVAQGGVVVRVAVDVACCKRAQLYNAAAEGKREGQSNKPTQMLVLCPLCNVDAELRDRFRCVIVFV
jgi:hypothetical protein